jgi:hypothetical protein
VIPLMSRYFHFSKTLKEIRIFAQNEDGIQMDIYIYIYIYIYIACVLRTVSIKNAIESHH